MQSSWNVKRRIFVDETGLQTLAERKGWISDKCSLNNGAEDGADALSMPKSVSEAWETRHIRPYHRNTFATIANSLFRHCHQEELRFSDPGCVSNLRWTDWQPWSHWRRRADVVSVASRMRTGPQPTPPTDDGLVSPNRLKTTFPDSSKSQERRVRCPDRRKCGDGRVIRYIGT